MLTILSIIMGFASSFVSGLFGGGSGLVTVPSIYWMLVHFYPDAHHYMQVTLGTGCVLAIPLGAIASWRQFHYKNVDVPMLKRVLVPILLGALIGALTIDYLHSDSLKYIFSSVIFVVGLWMWRFKLDAAIAWDLPNPVFHAVAVCVGFFSALLGVSVFTVPFLMKSGIEIKKAIGTATVLVFAYCVFVGAWFVYLGFNEVSLPGKTLGFVSVPVFLAATLPGVVASFAAVKCVNILPKQLLKVLFVVLLFVVSALMLIPH